MHDGTYKDGNMIIPLLLVSSVRMLRGIYMARRPQLATLLQLDTRRTISYELQPRRVHR